MDGLLELLTPAQREAVQHVNGPLLILAGPGSGKTRVVTHRIAYLLQQGVHPGQILALTFTNKAADEMRSRVEQLAPGQPVWIGTYHRFCARLLRKYAPLVGLEENYTIYDTDDAARTLRRVIARLKIDLAHFTPESLASAISHAKNHLLTAADYRPRPGHPLGAIAARVYPAYQAQLTAANAVDFDDLLLHVAVLLRENPEVRQSLDDRYRFVQVDEYQDTNLAQYAIVRALSIDHPNLAVTGDPDQSIYGWRGANLNNILEFERDFPDVRVVRLERNYRSTKSILRVAAQLISHNLRRKQKDLYTENGDGSPVRLVTYTDQKEEARQIAAEIAAAIRAGRRRGRDYAVFYRVNALSWPLEQALREQGVPFQLVRGVEFFQRKEIKDILAYLQLLNNPRDAVAFHRVINTPARGIGKTTLDRLDAHAVRRGLSLLDAARDAGSIESLAKSAAKKIQAFVALFDRLAAVAGAAVEEILGHVLTESGYKRQFEHSENEEDFQRLANIEELLSVARDFDERHAGRRPLEDFSGRDQPGQRHGQLGRAERSRHADDPARLEGTGVSRGLPGGRRRRAAAARAEPRSPGAGGRGTPLDVRGHYPGPGGAANQPGRLPRFPRPAKNDHSQSVPHGAAPGGDGADRQRARLGRRRGSGLRRQLSPRRPAVVARRAGVAAGANGAALVNAHGRKPADDGSGVGPRRRSRRSRRTIFIRT